jgi:general secretion pathway protein H
MNTRRAGFTLFELLAVIVLMALAMGLLGLAIGQGLQAARERQAVRDLVLALRETRTHAVLSGAPALLRFDLAGRWYQAAGRARQPLSPTMGVQLSVAQPWGNAFVFFADGGSSGGHVLLTRGKQRWRIDVAWLTGGVRWQVVP